jgi:hypothetical protein
VVSNPERLFVLDRAWSVCREITHPWFGGIHDLLCEPDGIWLTCTDLDLLVKVGWDGTIIDSWNWRRDPDLVHTLGFRSVPPFDPSVDHRDPLITHARVGNIVNLNAVSREGERLLLSFGRVVPPRLVRWQLTKARVASMLGRGKLGRAAVGAVRRSRDILSGRAGRPERFRGSTSAIVRLHANGTELHTAEVVLRTPTSAGVPNHNVFESGSVLVYNDANAGALVSYDAATGRRQAVAIPGAPPFPRGLVPLENGLFAVGDQRPAAVHLVDLAAGRIWRSLVFTGPANESVYAIAALPDHFDDPPPRIFGS